MRTPSQTVGPYFEIGLPWDTGPFAGDEGVSITGTVLDGAGEPVRDAMIETWQSDPPVASDFRAFTRCGMDDAGTFAIRTRKPAAVEGQAPHLAVSVFARGLLCRLVTRIYFPEEDNHTDPILATVPENRRNTLIAAPVGDGSYRFDIHLQGEGETVFFTL